MEALWDYTNTVYEIVDLFLNALIVMLFYRTYLRNRSRILAVGMAYFLAMAVLYLMPYNIQAVFAYGLGITAVCLASTAFGQKEDLPQKVFLAVTIYLLKWIASGLTIIPWNLISSLTFANPNDRYNSNREGSRADSHDDHQIITIHIKKMTNCCGGVHISSKTKSNDALIRN